MNQSPLRYLNPPDYYFQPLTLFHLSLMLILSFIFKELNVFIPIETTRIQIH